MPVKSFTINVESGLVLNRSNCVCGQASIGSSVSGLNLGDVDMADDIVVNGHILAHDVPKNVKSTCYLLLHKFLSPFPYNTLRCLVCSPNNTLASI